MLVYEDNPQRDVGTNIVYTWNKHWLYINNSSVHSVGVGDRFIAPVCTKLYKCNHASQWVYVDKHWLYTVIRSVYSVICGHDKSAPYSGCTWCKRWCTWVNITYSWCKHWLYINNRSVHSVGVGADSSRPFTPNCINAITHHNGCTWVKHWLYTVIRSVYSVICGHDKSAPTVGARG